MGGFIGEDKWERRKVCGDRRGTIDVLHVIECTRRDGGDGHWCERDGGGMAG